MHWVAKYYVYFREYCYDLLFLSSIYPCSALQPTGAAGVREPATEGRSRSCSSWVPRGCGAAEAAGREQSLAEKHGRCMEAFLGIYKLQVLSRARKGKERNFRVRLGLPELVCDFAYLKPFNSLSQTLVIYTVHRNVCARKMESR